MEEFKEEAVRPREGFWTYGRVAVLALGVVLIFLAFSTSSRRAERSPSASTSKSASSYQPPAAVMNEALQSLDGETFRLSDYKGKIVVLDLWATWCGPCQMEIPHLVKISEEYAGRGVEVVGLTVEDPEYDAEKVRNFAREFRINYRLGWAAPDWFMSMTRNNGAIPQTFVIDRDGLIRLHAPGYSPNLPRIIREAIEKAGA